MTEYTAKDIARFWKYVDTSAGLFGCWKWIGCIGQDGYGKIRIGNRHMRAHRVVWELTQGEILDGLCVCHRCDNPPCVNPAHLFLGTNIDNVRDREKKDRNNHVVGESHPQHKLTDVQVDEIRTRYANGGITMQALADQFGVGLAQIWRIVRLKERIS